MSINSASSARARLLGTPDPNQPTNTDHFAVPGRERRGFSPDTCHVRPVAPVAPFKDTDMTTIPYQTALDFIEGLREFIDTKYSGANHLCRFLYDNAPDGLVELCRLVRLTTNLKDYDSDYNAAALFDVLGCPELITAYKQSSGSHFHKADGYKHIIKLLKPYKGRHSDPHKKGVPIAYVLGLMLVYSPEFAVSTIDDFIAYANNPIPVTCDSRASAGLISKEEITNE